MWTNFASHCIWRSIKSLKYVLYAQRYCHCILGADLLSAAGSCRAACVFISTHSPPPLNRVWALHSFLLLLNAAHTVRPLPPRSLFFFSTHPPISHSISSIQGDARPSHPAPFNSVHCVHFIPAPIPRIFRILGETLRILRTQRARSFIKPKPRGHPGVGRVLPDAVATPIRGEVRELIHIEANESR